MSWAAIFFWLFVAAVFIAEHFRSTAVHYEEQANYWRREAEKRVKKEEAFEHWMPTGGRHPVRNWDN